MKPTELRIGNIYMSEKFNMPAYLDASDIYEMVCDADGAEIEPDKFVKPIPLTEEWLINIGFVSNPYKDRYEMESFFVECDKTKGHLQLWVEGVPCDLRYVHQLQNIYFVMTGQELVPFIKGVWK